MNAGLVITLAVLGALAGMFIREAREHDRAYGPLSADDFDTDPAPTAVDRVLSPARSATVPRSAEGRGAPDEFAASAQGDATPLAHTFARPPRRYFDRGQRGYSWEATCSTCRAHVMGQPTSQSCYDWLELHPQVEHWLESIGAGRPFRMISGDVADLSVPVAARVASPLDRWDVLVRGVPAARNLPASVARDAAESAIATHGPEHVELRPALTT